MKTLRLLIVFVFLLAGCATTPPAPTATVAPEATATVEILPTATEAAPLPTETAAPTAIPATSTPSADQQEQEKLAALVAPCVATGPQFIESPKKDWVFAACKSENQDGMITRFASTRDAKKWDISFVDAYINPYKADDANMSKLLEEYLIPMHWTMNEDFVYLAAPTPYQNELYFSYDGLFRLNLSTGEIKPVLRPATAPLSVSYSFTFSPNGNKLAYINQAVQTVMIVIEDTSNGDQQTITLDPRFVKGGNIIWSADEKKLIVSAMDANTNGGNSLIMYDLETNKNEYIIQQSSTIYLPVSWVDENTIYATTNTGSWVYIDLTTKKSTYAPAPAVMH